MPQPLIRVKRTIPMKVIKHKFEGPITIIPISDVHIGSLECNERAWKGFCDRLQQMPNTYIVLVGDLVNNGIRSSVANPFDETLRPREQKYKMIEYLKPIKDRILGAVAGNHEHRTKKEVDGDITYDILCNLDLETLYREDIAFIKITCGVNAYAIALTHGCGGGVLTGSAINKNERFSGTIEGLDCFISAHTHKGAITRPSRLVFDLNHSAISQRTCTVITAESWLNYGGYAARKMLFPAETCRPQKLRFNDKKDGKQITIEW